MVYCHIKLLRKIFEVKRNLSNFMIKKLLLKDKFKRLDEENERMGGSIFDLLSMIIQEPEIQNVFKNKIGFSPEGIEVLHTVEQNLDFNPSQAMAANASAVQHGV